MANIKVTRVEFKPTYSFRKFKDLAIPIYPRITLICGHNGVGKSTILGLISGLSGARINEPDSYFGKKFDANIASIIYIDLATEVTAPKAASTLSEPLVHYDIDGTPLVKECSLRKRGNSPRARVVAMSVPYKKFSAAGFDIGPDQKVPFPTIFLGMVRMLPVGESPDSRIQNGVPTKWHVDDETFMLKFMKKVIPGAGAKAGTISTNRIKLTGKLSTHPAYPYSPRAVSLGQDSLGSIVTALASFNKLKRQKGVDYAGGLLVIDELDAGFHPHALAVLAKELRVAADDLHLQIVATTHSPGLIEAIHPQGPNKSKSGVDGVIYLRNTKQPEYDPSLELTDILNDMSLVPPSVATEVPKIKIYFEDDEAAEVFKILTSPTVIKTLEQAHGVKLTPMPLGIGCSSLARLPSKDDYFKTVVLILDADGETSVTNPPPNLVSLPGGVGLSALGLSPERTLLQFITALADEPTSNHVAAWKDPRLKKYSQESLEEHLLTDWRGPLNRKQAKKWWKDKCHLLRAWGLYEIWAANHPALIAAYETQLELAVKAAVKERRLQNMLAKR